MAGEGLMVTTAVCPSCGACFTEPFENVSEQESIADVTMLYEEHYLMCHAHSAA